MFVRNRTPFDPVLARGHITDDLAALSLNLEVVYHLASDGTLHLTTSSSRLDSDPPDIRRRPLWRGVSVTAFGQVRAPIRPPHLKVVQLSAGDLHHRLVVFGARRWRKAVGQVVATEPMPFDSVPLDWEHAFGGFFDRPAGYSDDGKLPHPGGRMVYGFNPDGVGFYPHADAALEQPLPRIERQDMLVRSWSDRPVPGGLAPCPRLAGLRVDTLGQILDDGMRSDGRPASPRLVGPMLRKLGVALRQQHHAPGATIARRLDPGHPVVLDGVGAMPLRFEMPAMPAQVSLIEGRRSIALHGAARSVHVDADTRTVRIVFGYPHRYAPRRPPRSLHIGSVTP